MRTFGECFDELMELQAFELAPHTIRSKKSAYKKHLSPYIGSSMITELRYPVLQSVLNGMLKNGYANKTVAHIRDIIRTVYSHALRCEYIEKNPSLHLVVKRIDNRRFLMLSQAEIVSFVSAVKNEPCLYTRCLFMFLLHGRRLNEARQLRWDWLNLEKQTVTIPALHSKDRYMHTYALSDEFVNELRFLPVHSDLVFPSAVTGVQFVDIRRPFKRILKRAGIDKKKMRIHDIRHLVGTAAVAAGMKLEEVMFALGHQSINTTKRYVTAGTAESSRISSLVFNLSISGGVK